MKTFLLRLQTDADDIDSARLDTALSGLLQHARFGTGGQITSIRVLGEHPDAPTDGDPFDAGAYQEQLARVSTDLDLDPAVLDSAFQAWLAHPGPLDDSLTPAMNAACYTLYRVTKLISSLRGMERIVERREQGADDLRRRATRHEALDRAAQAICLLDAQTTAEITRSRWDSDEDTRAHYRQLADAALHVALIEPGEAPDPPPAPEPLPLDASTERALAHLLQTLTDNGYDDATIGPLATLREQLEVRAAVRATEPS